MSKRILVEGLDLVGKTTICKKLVEDYPDVFIYKKAFYSIENELYREAVLKSKLGVYSEETIAWLYIAAAKHELDLTLQQNEKSNLVIIQDSFFLNRMIGVHGVTNRILLLSEIKDLLSKFESPLYTFYIYSDIDVRRKRFYDRKGIKEPAYGDKLVFEDEVDAKRRENIFREYIKSIYETETIDNSYGDIKKIEQKIYKKTLSLLERDK